MENLRKLAQGPPPQQGPEHPKMPPLKDFEVHEATVADLQEHFARGHFTAVEYAVHCLERIRVLNPYLEAIIETNPDALEAAAAADEERRASGDQRKLNPLHGIPVLIKDNIAPADRMQTTAGSWALLASVPAHDAGVLTRLRAAGAVVLAKTNMSEWASLRSKSHSTGYSPRGGQCRNPYDLRRSPFSSSSGSAAAVAAGVAPVAIGTETDTSVIGPAGVNGVVGIKPGIGVTTRSGTVPISDKMDVVGCFGRTVADAAAVLDVIAGPDDDDPATRTEEAQKEHQSRLSSGGYIGCVSPADCLRGARFGIPMKRCWDLVSPACRAVAERVVEAMRRAGAEVVEVDLPSIEERVAEHGNWNWEHGTPTTSEWTVARVDAYNGMNAYLRTLVQSLVRSVEDVVQFNKDNDGTEGASPGVVPAYPSGQDNLLEMVESKGIEGDTYHAALQHIRSQSREHGIDAALASPSVAADSRPLDGLIFCDRRGIGQQYAAQAGYPVICIPIGVDDNGIPVSLSFQHTAWKEREMIRWASAVEDLWNRETGWRPLPTFKNLHAKNIPVERID